MNESGAEKTAVWQKTPCANLVRYVPSGKYFARLRVQGKRIRRCLKTNKIGVAKRRLADLEKVERQRVETQGAVVNGTMTSGDARANHEAEVHLAGMEVDSAVVFSRRIVFHSCS